MNNLATTVPVSPIPTTRVHKDHPLEQIIGDIHSEPQTGRMTKNVTEHIEPKKVTQGLTDPSWIEAMQDKLLQFKFLKVWTLVELPYGKRAIDYDEVFTPVARIESIRLFLAYASFMNFIIYQMDVKSAFLYGTIKEEVEKALYGLHQAPRAWYETLSTYLLENGFRRGTTDKTLFIKKDKGDILLVQVYVDDIIFRSTKKSLYTEFEQMMHKRFQMSSIGELTLFLGFQVKQKDDGIFISQDKHGADILKKFDFSTLRTTSTPIETNKALLKDEEAADVDFWATAKAMTDIGERQIQALVDKKRVLDLEEPKTAQAKEIASLNKRVKQLEKRKKLRTSRLKRLRKGRKIANLDVDEEVTLIDETQERNDEELLFDVQDDLQGEEVVAEKEVVEKEVSAADPVTTAGEVVTTTNVEDTTSSAPTTTIDELTLAQTLIEIKAAKPKAVTTAATTTTTTRPKAKGVVVQEPSKAKMVEPEKPSKRKDQIALDEEMALRLHAEEQAELERMQKERVAQE
ncbi:putative ribonuclease H-like domain-containing protein [Tanacetum coccineum]